MARVIAYVFLLATVRSIAQAVECFHARTALPLVLECEKLAAELVGFSQRPRENNIKSWGARLQTTYEAQQVPTVYVRTLRQNFGLAPL